MKATGIIRRIDDLGRIVIPKEIRKSLKLNEGDSLEIYIEDNNVLLKKNSVLDNNKLYEELIDSFYKIYKKNIIITDKEKIIAISKDVNNYLNNDLTSIVRDLIIDRKDKVIRDNRIIIDGEVVPSFYILPIIIDSDAIGSIILIDDEIDEEEKNIIKLLNNILVKNIE